MKPCVTYCANTNVKGRHCEFYAGNDRGYGWFDDNDFQELQHSGLEVLKYGRFFHRTYAMPWVLLTNEGVDLL